MKPGHFILILLVYLMACSRGSDPMPPNPPATLDSLGAWEKVGGFSGSPLDVAFVSPAKGYICVPYKGIFKSVDSGKTWSLLPLSDLAHGVGTINFSDAQHGYCIGNSFGYTMDGGENWTFKELNPINDFPSPADVYFIAPANGFIATGKGIYQTRDTGTTWQLKVNGYFNSVYFSDPSHGWATELHSIYHTVDGGNTWSIQYTLNGTISNVYFIDNTNGWVASHSDSTLLRTTNGGQTWQATQLDGQLLDLHFLNKNLGYITADKKIYKTTDGGLSWKQEVKISEGQFVELFFLDATKGWAVGIPSLILRLKP